MGKVDAWDSGGRGILSQPGDPGDMSSAGASVVKQLIGKELGSKAAVRSGNEIPKQLTLGYYSRTL